MLAERGTTTYTAYIGKLDGGIAIIGIASGKDFGEVESDVRKAYESKYRC